MYSFDQEVQYKQINIGNISFLCIYYPNHLDFLNELYFDNNTVCQLTNITGLIEDGIIANNIITQV